MNSIEARRGFLRSMKDATHRLFDRFGGRIIALSAMWFLAVGTTRLLFVPAHLFLTGTQSPARVTKCYPGQEVLVSEKFTAISNASVLATGFDGPIAIAECDPKASGYLITVIDSPVEGRRIGIVGQHATIWQVYSMFLSIQTGFGLFLSTLICVCLTFYRLRMLYKYGAKACAESFAGVAIPFRDSASTVQTNQSITGEQLRSWVTKFLPSALKATDALTDLCFLLLIFAWVGVVTYALLAGLLRSPYGGIWFEAIAGAVCMVFWSPAPNAVVRYAWRAYRKPSRLRIRIYGASAHRRARSCGWSRPGRLAFRRACRNRRHAARQPESFGSRFSGAAGSHSRSARPRPYCWRRPVWAWPPGLRCGSAAS